MGDLPDFIPFSCVREVLESFGISVDTLQSVTFGIHGVIVKQVRTIANGRSLPFGDDVATITTTIGYDREDENR